MVDVDECATSASYGVDFRWYFSKQQIQKSDFAASIPSTPIIDKGEFLRFSAEDSLVLETAFLKREEEYLTAWWKEYAECSEGPVPPEPRPSGATEDVHAVDWLDPFSAEGEEFVGVPVKGGLYEVDLLTRRSSAVYWGGLNRRVLRGTWYALIGSHWLPLREDIAEQIEVAFNCRVWRYRGYEPSGLYAARVPLSGVPQGHYALFTGDDSTWEAWFVGGYSWQGHLAGTAPGIPLRRGFREPPDFAPYTKEDRAQQAEEDFDDYCSQVSVSHLVFMVHGIGQKMDSADLIRQVSDFRTNVALLSQACLTRSQQRQQRCLFIPVQWRRRLTLGSELMVEDITLEGVRPLRTAVSATVHDVLYYMSPAYCQDIVDSVTANLNFLFRKFRRRNPQFNGKVSVYGHSLGSVLLHDILCHQPARKGTLNPKPSPQEPLRVQEKSPSPSPLSFSPEPTRRTPETLRVLSVSPGQERSTGEESCQGGSSRRTVTSWDRRRPAEEGESSGTRRRKKSTVLNEVDFDGHSAAEGESSSVKESQPSSGDEGGKEIAESAGDPGEPGPSGRSTEVNSGEDRGRERQHAPRVKYDRLDFEVDIFFAVGSPLGLFLALRNIRLGTGACPHLRAGEQEEMPECRKLLNIFHPFDPVAYRIEPLVSREFLKLQPVLAPHHNSRRRLHIAIKEFESEAWRRLLMGWRRVCHALRSFQVKLIGLLSGGRSRKIFADELSEEEEGRRLNLDEYSRGVITRLTGSPEGRIDHVLQEATFEHQYIVALQCHLSYWNDKDTALLVLEHLYRDIPAVSQGDELRRAKEQKSSRRRSTSASQIEFDFEEEDGVALTFQSGGKVARALAEALRVSRAADPLRAKNWGLAV